MNSNEETTEQLALRLPELLWRMNKVGLRIQEQVLPEGLFKCTGDDRPQSYIQEIKSDLSAIKHETSKNSTQFLANRISRKINLLVRLCRLHEKKLSPKCSAHLDIQTLATRQQWLQQLEQNIQSLSEQKESLARRLNHCQSASQQDQQAILILQRDLGEIEKQITLAQETWKKVTS
ncbi:primosomal replication protein PriC [Legionella yabuuchiae]|uniref:primosomal replication protein PriC n=1 Tax=Legionella yabuuchiae TaxID=376727 RepID=UPI0010554033|nr:primosomal replication protein PriC [Legionella yabuuchiae]